MPRRLGVSLFVLSACAAEPLSVETAEADAAMPSEGALSNDAAPASDAGLPSDGAHVVPTFFKQVLTTEFVAEGATFCDVDRDGSADAVAGADWYPGPSYDVAYPFRPHVAYDPVQYSDAFATYCHDFDADGWLDILILGFPGRDASWYLNPQSNARDWERQIAFEPVDNEAAVWLDLTQDDSPELVFSTGGYLGWAAPDPTDPSLPFVFQPVSTQGDWGAFTHGLGVGDVDGDGRRDLIDAEGYWLQPADGSGAALWTRHLAAFGEGGAQMFTRDVDGDGDQDVITSQQAHGYGVAWYERLESNDYAEHVISGTPSDLGTTEIALHEPHALTVVDIDRDGLDDILTGERFWGHAPADAAERDLTAPARLVWFRLTQDATGTHFTPHVIDEQSGVGVQVHAQVLEDDSMAIVVANKKGVFVFRQQR